MWHIAWWPSSVLYCVFESYWKNNLRSSCHKETLFPTVTDLPWWALCNMYKHGIITWSTWSWRDVLQRFSHVVSIRITWRACWSSLPSPGPRVPDLVVLDRGTLSTPAEVMPRCAAPIPLPDCGTQSAAADPSVSPQKRPLLAPRECLPQAYQPSCGAHIGWPATQGSCVGEITSRRQTRKQLREKWVWTWVLDVHGNGQNLGRTARPAAERSLMRLPSLSLAES